MPPRVLVIEDAPYWCKAFKQILTGIGCDVEIAENHEKAEKSLKEAKYDLVLLDVCLEGNVITIKDQLLWEHLKKECPGIPILAVTGKDLEPEDVFQLAKSGIKDFFMKSRIKIPDFKRRILNTLGECLSVRRPLPPEPNDNEEGHSMLTPEQQAAWLILQKAFILVSDELKQRWQVARERSKSAKAAQDVQAQSGVSGSLQTALKIQLEQTRDTAQLRMMTNDLETAIEMAEKYNIRCNLYRQELPDAIDPVPIRMQIEKAAKKRDGAVAEIRDIFEKLAKAEVVITDDSA